MGLVKKLGLPSLLIAASLVVSLSPIASAATSPGIGAANSFTILSKTYTNTVGTTTIAGDLGYTTGPALAPVVGGTTHVADGTYNQAGIDQNNALSALNNQPCTFNFAPGPIDLATDTTHGPVGVYTPGVYCMTGASNAVLGGTVTLDGSGTYIFRMDGALTTGANSSFTLINGASACDVWWTPTQATTLGANSHFVGTNIDASGITIGDTVTWEGQALAFGGTVTTTNDTMTSAACSASRADTPAAPVVPATPTAPTVPGVPDTAVASSDNVPAVLSGMIIIFAASAIIYGVRKKQRSL